MADPLTLILLVAAGEAVDPMTHGIAMAARTALGSDARVLIHPCPGPPNDPEALDAEASAHADGIVELRWSQPHHRQASLRMHVATTNSWIDRRFDFRRADADAERERTLAFAIASILPEPVTAPATAPPTASTVNGAATPAVGGNDADSGANVEAQPAENQETKTSHPSAANGARGSDRPPALDTAPETKRGASAAASTVPPAAPSNMGLEVLVVDAVGDGEGAQEIGGAAALGWFVWRNVSVRAGGSVRDASLDQASGDLLKVTAAAGVAFHPWRATLARPFGASFRVDYLLLYERLTRVTPPGRNEPTFDHVLSGCDAMIDSSWLFAPSVEVIAGGGVEAFAPTTIQQGGTSVSLPIARAVFEAGLRLRF